MVAALKRSRRLVAAPLSRWQRRSAFTSTLRSLTRARALDAEGLADFLDRQTAELLAAAQLVPFQKKRLQASGTTSIEAMGREALRRIPAVRKDQLREAPLEILLRQNAARHRLGSQRTSGSTGVPFEFFFDRHYHDRGRAVRALVYRELSYRGGPIVEMFAIAGARGRAVPASPGFGVHMIDYGLPLEELADVIDEISPVVLYGNRSHHLAVAELSAQRHGVGASPIELVVSSSETLLDTDREAIAEKLGARVHDLYGLAEVSAVAWECVPGEGYHVLEPRVVVDVELDGDQVGPGEEGEVVVTSFDNMVMPFIRYASGDRAVVGDRPCPCGRPGMVLQQLSGRLVDFLIDASGRSVNPWAVATSGFWGREELRQAVRQWQVVQDPDLGLEVLLVPLEPGGRAAVEQQVRHFISHALGGVNVQVSWVTRIEPEPNGKFKAVKRITP